MTDWKVKVETQDHQIRNVTVYDFVYPSDASRAALAQSAGVRVVSIVPHYQDKVVEFPTSDYNNSLNNSYTYSKSYSDETDKDWIFYYFIAASIPTAILFFIHPILAISFNAAFLWWWFKK